MQRRDKILLLCGVGHFYSHFFNLAFPVMALWLRKDFGISAAEALSLGFGLYLMFGLAAVPMGLLGDRFNNRILLSIMLIGIGLTAFASALAPNPDILFWTLTLMGVFIAMYHPIGMALISRCCERRGEAMGNNGIWGNMGIGLAPLIAGLLCFLGDWELAFVACGLPPLVLGILFLRADIDETPIEEAVKSVPDSNRALPLLILMIGMTLLGFIYRGSIVTFPVALEEQARSMYTDIGGDSRDAQGFKLMAAGLMACIYLFSSLGQLVGGKLAQRTDLRVAYFWFHLLSLPAMWGLSLVHGIAMLPVGMAYTFFALGMQPIENSLVAHLTPSRLRSFAYSLKFILVFGVCALSVKTSKWLIDQDRLADVFRLQAGLLVLVLLGIGALFWTTRGNPIRNQ